jgi:hypothetical protein
MLYYLQMVLGGLFLYVGIPHYVQHGDIFPLVQIVIGAILITVGAVVVNVRQMLRDESKRRGQESKPVLNI